MYVWNAIVDSVGWATRRRDELLALRDQLEREIAELDQMVRKEAEASPTARYLMQHQVGVGPVTALAVVLTLGPVERFSTAKKLPAMWV
jgi:transposase